jgi:hypothetical protein
MAEIKGKLLNANEVVAGLDDEEGRKEIERKLSELEEIKRTIDDNVDFTRTMLVIARLPSGRTSILITVSEEDYEGDELKGKCKQIFDACEKLGLSPIIKEDHHGRVMHITKR